MNLLSDSDVICQKAADRLPTEQEKYLRRKTGYSETNHFYSLLRLTLNLLRAFVHELKRNITRCITTIFAAKA